MKGRMWCLAVLGLLAGTSLMRADSVTAQLFLGDYSDSQVVRYDGNTPDTFINKFSAGGNVEGMGGYSVGTGLSKVNHLLVGLGSQIKDYIVTGPPTNGQSLYNHIPTSSGNLQITVANDGNSVYSAQFTNGITQYSIVPGPSYGTVLSHTFVMAGNAGSHANVWGVAVEKGTGNVIASANWSSASDSIHVGINKYSSSLAYIGSLVAYGDHGLTHGAGITYAPDGSFYVVNGGNAAPGPGPGTFVLHYAADGTFLNKLTDPLNAFKNAFQPAIGPDGNLYVSNQEGNCVVEFNITDPLHYGEESVFITAATADANGASAKTLYFTSNDIPQTVPEPATMIMALLGVAGGAGYGWRRKRKEEGTL